MTRAPEREQSRSEVRREKIMEAALDVFSRHGYGQSAMDEIAAESETSKGGLYFHFPNKQTIFVALLDRMAALLMTRAEASIAAEPDPLQKVDVALKVVLETFGGHRRMSRLFLVDAFGASREFNEKMIEVHRAFAGLIARHLDDAVEQGVIAPLNTTLAAQVWFGALNEVVMNWVLEDNPPPLDSAYPDLRALLRRSVGAPVAGSEGNA